MSKDIETDMTKHKATKFWGGSDKGDCIQITSNNIDEGYIQLTMEEAVSLVNCLIEFIKNEAVRRQELLKLKIKELKNREKLIVNEIAELDEKYFTIKKVALDLVSRFCPKSKTEGNRTIKG